MNQLEKYNTIEKCRKRHDMTFNRTKNMNFNQSTKRRLISFIIRDMQYETIVRYFYHSRQIGTKLKCQKLSSVDENVEQLELSFTVFETVHCASLENSLVFSVKDAQK